MATFLAIVSHHHGNRFSFLIIDTHGGSRSSLSQLIGTGMMATKYGRSIALHLYKVSNFLLGW